MDVPYSHFELLVCFLVSPTPRPTARAIITASTIKPMHASRINPPRVGGRWFLRTSANFSPFGPRTSVYSVYGGGFRLEWRVGGNAKLRTRCMGLWCDLAGTSGLMPPFSSIAPSRVALATRCGDGVPLCTHPFGTAGPVWFSESMLAEAMLAEFRKRAELQQAVLLSRWAVILGSSAVLRSWCKVQGCARRLSNDVSIRSGLAFESKPEYISF